jgi:transposase InsO family protein
MAKMVGLQFQIRYKKGIENGAADSLSRVAHLMAISTVSYCRPDWAQEVINSYATDVKAQELLVQLAVLSPNSKGYALEEGLIRYKGRLFIGNNSALQTKLISAMHSSAVGGHSGVRATYQRVRKQYYWPGIKQQVEDWVKQCQLCQQAKHENTLPAGLLQPLPVPTRAWSDITMDFIDGLPKSEGYEVILVVVDRLTKYSHFIPLRRPYTAFSVATAFLDNVVKLHGVPASIVSDRDRVFTSTFWRQLFKVVGTKLSYSTAYHPQTDGQSERVNQCLEQYLRCAAHDSPTKWRKWLPMAEFWYNSSFHTSLGCSPFQALYGVEPNFGAMPNLGSATGTAITDVAAERQAFQDLLREHLLRAQVRMKNQADKHRSDRQFQVGDDVLLKLQPYVQSSLVQRPSAKMALKFYGPYKVLARVGATSYKLALPSDSKIHPVFHISQLKPFTPNYSPVFSELPSLVDFSTAEFYPQYILERRMVKRGNAAIPQIKVQWSSLSPDSATWEDYQVLRQRFPDASIWNGASTQGGESVTSPLPLAVVTDTKIDPG